MKSECSVAGCDRSARFGGYCQAHYARVWRTGEAGEPEIKVLRRSPEPCVVVGCDRNAKIGAYCSPHGRRLARTGDVGPTTIRRQAANGKGMPTINADGYRIVIAPGHPNAYRNGRILEHVLVMSDLLGRPLLPGETVHHINGIRNDNRGENLELWSTRHPRGVRVSALVSWAREILELYGSYEAFHSSSAGAGSPAPAHITSGGN